MKENYVNAGWMAEKAANSPVHKPLLEKIHRISVFNVHNSLALGAPFGFIFFTLEKNVNSNRICIL